MIQDQLVPLYFDDFCSQAVSCVEGDAGTFEPAGGLAETDPHAVQQIDPAVGNGYLFSLPLPLVPVERFVGDPVLIFRVNGHPGINIFLPEMDQEDLMKLFIPDSFDFHFVLKSFLVCSEIRLLVIVDGSVGMEETSLGRDSLSGSEILCRFDLHDAGTFFNFSRDRFFRTACSVIGGDDPFPIHFLLPLIYKSNSKRFGSSLLKIVSSARFPSRENLRSGLWRSPPRPVIPCHGSAFRDR